MKEPAKGVLYGLAAYGTWGIVAIYFRALRRVPPLEILAHRIVWSVAVLFILVTVMGRWPALIAVTRSGRALRLLLLSSSLVATNWYLFIWAVSSNHLVDASLGYFITPLVSVLLGFTFLRERLRRLEWVSVALAGAAVTWLAIGAGVVPWISLGVALTFAMYGLVRKIARVQAVEGLTIETAMLLPVAALYLLTITSHFHPLLPASGPITALPLLWFAAAVQRLRLATVGLLQYLSPTIQACVAVALFGEPFGTTRLVAFVLIWTAIAIYSAANLRRYSTNDTTV
ncbi:MAG TPA: EamA family transporter RarD [Thermoanaerobaculia bacterium]|nr:EamA family transporter RarD [Thermoanaerobaculia bacterium]